MILGVDVGTGGTRAVLIDRAGKVVASFASEHAPIRSEHIGWAEQEPEDWWRATREAIAGAMAASELTGAEIEGVLVAGPAVHPQEDARLGPLLRLRGPGGQERQPVREREPEDAGGA